MKYWILVLTFLLTACQMKMDLPPVSEVREIPRVSKHIKQHPLSFEKAIIDLPHDYIYIAYPYFDWSFWDTDMAWHDTCNVLNSRRFSNSTWNWAKDKSNLASWGSEAGTYVDRALESLGYDVVRSDKTSFDVYYEKSRAELLISATVVDLKINLCDLYFRWDWRSTNQSVGEAYMKVNWEIYDPLNKNTMGKITTEGIGYLPTPMKKGKELILMRALENAAENLGRSQEFYDIVIGKSQTYPYPQKYKHSWLELVASRPLYNQGIQKDYNFIRRSVILVRTSGGHGSGFYINDEGYALTNYHVVGQAKTVSVVDSIGTTYTADVIRVDKRRDVALIKAPISNNTYIPLQTKKFPKMLDKVYALGAPLRESLKGTVSEGIISNFRKSSRTGLGMIQASVEIAPGSSGGPLLDKYGNVIGIAVEGYGQNVTQYSRFIPIVDALKALNLHLVKQPTFP